MNAVLAITVKELPYAEQTTCYFFDAIGQTVSILYRDATRVTFDR